MGFSVSVFQGFSTMGFRAMAFGAMGFTAMGLVLWAVEPLCMWFAFTWQFP